MPAWTEPPAQGLSREGQNRIRSQPREPLPWKSRSSVFARETPDLYPYSHARRAVFARTPSLGHALLRDIVLFVILAICWALWSGHLTDPLLLCFGAGSCLLVTWMARRMDTHDQAPTSWGVAARSLLYLPWLLLEIIKANLHVTRIILDPKLPIEPQLVRGATTQKSELGQVVYANSITLTPGTITLDLRGQSVLVHAISDQTAAGITEGEMDRKVTAMEGAK